MNERTRQLAKRAGFMPSNFISRWDAEFVLFAELIAAKEREACAKAVEGYCGAWDDQGYALTQIIRARGGKHDTRRKSKGTV